MWPDADGRHIQAHGGGILFHAGLYYWYGEDKSLGTGQNHVGISCYSSQDLLNWKHQGTCLPSESMPHQFQAPGVVERPKVIYCRKTRKFVMWMHLETAERYHFASAGVATSDSPVGPFVFDRAFRPIQYDFGYPADDWCEQRQRGPTYRDMNLFVDDDGAAYVLYAAEDNATLYIARLNDQFTDVVHPSVEGRTWTRNFIGALREAPALFKHAGKYYLFTSGCTGWHPNPAMLASADQILGPWKVLGDPCVGPDAHTTFSSQSTCVLPAPGKPAGCFIYMGDRWFANHLEESRYVWLPFVAPSSLRRDVPVTLDYLPEWNLSIFDARGVIFNAPEAQLEGEELAWNAVDNAGAYRVFCNGNHIGSTTSTRYRPELMAAGRPLHYEVIAYNLEGNFSRRSNTVIRASAPRRPIRLGDLRPETWKAAWISPYRNVDMNHDPLQTPEARHDSGMCQYAPGELQYLINGAYTRLSVQVGMRKESSEDNCVFRIFGDGRELAFTEPLSTRDRATSLSIGIRGVQRLKLVSEGKGTIVWGDAMLHID